MAADTQASTDSGSIDRITKVHRLPDGSLVGYCGSAKQGHQFIEWLKSERGEPCPDIPDMQALILDHDHVLWDVAGAWPPYVLNGNSAIGSGAQGALVALRVFGATPLQAVQAAATVDSNTSGPFTVLKLLQPVQTKRKLKST